MESDADALLLAGDVFDDERLSVATEAVLGDRLRDLVDAGVHVVLACGNHDHGAIGHRAHRLAWPKRRFDLVRERLPRVIDVHRGSELIARVTAAGYDERIVVDNLARGFPVPRVDVPEVALLHAQVEGSLGAAAHSPYAPCTTDDLRARPFDYWALGHVHRRQCVLERPAAHYPGNLQGRHHGEPGARGALLVEIAAPGAAPAVEFRDLAPIRFGTVRIDLGAVSESIDALRAEAARRMAALRAEGSAGHEWMVRVEVIGGSERGSLVDEELGTLAALFADDGGVIEVEVDASSLFAAPTAASDTASHPVLGILEEVVAECRADAAYLQELVGERPASGAAFSLDLVDGLEMRLARRLLRRPAR